ncbi:MAG: universal stress protein [Candidatus Promineifilaceae bacterium]
MNEQEKELVIRRILVAMDASTHSLAALEAAADLAASLEAELIGLYVEDENLLNLAGLPFAREVRPTSATSRRISSDRMEQELRLEALQARQAMKAAADRVQAQWTFRIVRGQVTQAVLTAALEADLIAMGRVGRPISKNSRLGSTARAATATINRSLLLLRHGRHLKYPIMVTYDGTRTARQALAAAVNLAKAGNGLKVLLLSDSASGAEQLKEEVTGWLEEHESELAVEFNWFPQATVDRLAQTIQAAEECVLVLGGESPLLQAEAIQELLDMTDCPVMLVR